jgi:glycine C-acetyltransferase
MEAIRMNDEASIAAINTDPFSQIRKLAKAVVENIYPDIDTVESSPAAEEIVIDGRKMVQFCSCSYLGLSNHPFLLEAAKEAIDKYGVGTTSSGIISGYTDVHRDAEEAIANFMGSESAIFFNSVTLTSQGIITTVVSPPLAAIFPGLIPDLSDTAVFSDEENHASLFDAVKLARPNKSYFYRHCDMNHLEDLLKRSNRKHRLIVTDGYFSMAADLAPLPEIADLAEKYGALLMVDDAHGSGVLGPNGQGSAEHFGVENRIHFLVGSFSKGFGVRGGFTIGDETFMKYLRVSSRGYVFSATLPPSIPAAAIKAMEIATEEPWRRASLLKNASTIREGLKQNGFTVLGDYHVVPWLIGDEEKTKAIDRELRNSAILAPCVRYPAVPKGKALIRFMPTANHTQKQIENLIDVCTKLGRRFGI